jgi:hypothetical protein
MTLPHSAYGCERFASEISWAYWQSPENALAPNSSNEEAGAMPPAAFRVLLSQLLGIPDPPVQGTFAGKLKRGTRLT